MQKIYNVGKYCEKMFEKCIGHSMSTLFLTVYAQKRVFLNFKTWYPIILAFNAAYTKCPVIFSENLEDSERKLILS